MKTEVKLKKLNTMLDVRGCQIKVGDVVLVRHPFPNTSRLEFGEVKKISEPNKKLVRFVQIGKSKKWWANPLKLADK